MLVVLAYFEIIFAIARISFLIIFILLFITEALDMSLVAHLLVFLFSSCETSPLDDSRCLQVIKALSLSDKLAVDISGVLVQESV